MKELCIVDPPLCCDVSPQDGCICFVKECVRPESFACHFFHIVMKQFSTDSSWKLNTVEIEGIQNIGQDWLTAKRSRYRGTVKQQCVESRSGTRVNNNYYRSADEWTCSARRTLAIHLAWDVAGAVLFTKAAALRGTSQWLLVQLALNDRQRVRVPFPTPSILFGVLTIK